MPIKNETKERIICDLCGKEVGKHLKQKDFFRDAPILVVKNHEGIPMSFQLNIDIWPTDEEDDIEETLGDVINMRDMMQSPQVQQQQIRIIQMDGVQQVIAENMDVADESVICKKCYKNLVNMIMTYGKFDKIENF